MSGLVSIGKGGPPEHFDRRQEASLDIVTEEKIPSESLDLGIGGQIQGGGEMLREGRPCLTQCQGWGSKRTRAGRFLYTAVMGVSDSAGVSDGI